MNSVLFETNIKPMCLEIIINLRYLRLAVSLFFFTINRHRGITWIIRGVAVSLVQLWRNHYPSGPHPACLQNVSSHHVWTIPGLNQYFKYIISKEGGRHELEETNTLHLSIVRGVVVWWRHVNWCETWIFRSWLGETCPLRSTTLEPTHLSSIYIAAVRNGNEFLCSQHNKLYVNCITLKLKMRQV